MIDSNSAWSKRLDAYWQAEGHLTAATQLVGTCWFVLVCQFAFIGLDHWVFPEQFSFFVTMRLTVNAAVLGVLLSWRHKYPNECQIAVPALVGIEILAMIYGSGDSDSLYFAGLILVMVGTPVLQPISTRGALLISSICVGGFVSCAAFMPDPMREQTFAIEIIFIIAAALESVFSCHALAITRVVSFEQRREIEATRDQLASLDEAKNRFSANIHHELRTPLTLILAPLETLRAGDFGDLPDPVVRTLQTMYVNGQRLLKLINNLLDLAKLESDRFSIQRREANLSNIVEVLIEAARPMAERKDISLQMEAPQELPRAFLDIEAVEKIVVNLLSNALKFTPAGGSVSIRVGTNDDRTKLSLEVKDSGAGLAPEDVERVFNRFAQVDGSNTREHEGTGIGLALTKELVSLHGGHIWAESEGIGLGSLMSVEFPLGEEDESQTEEAIQSGVKGPIDLDALAAEIATDSKLSQKDVLATDLERDIDRLKSDHSPIAKSNSGDDLRERPNIVVADDNADMRELLAFILNRDFSVQVACNGREALKLTRATNPDLVVTDIMMPVMSGTELCRAIKADPSISATPVMLVSSKADGEMKIEGLELGADDYVTKPFHPKELLARARGLVKVRTLQRKIEERNTSLETALNELKSAETKLIQSERLAAVGEIAAGIAHEVNNPVNFALNAVRALRTNFAELRLVADTFSTVDWDDEPKKTDQLRHLRDIIEGVGIDEAASTADELSGIIVDGLERTQLLVAELRDFAAPNADKYIDVNLTEGIRSTAALLRPSITSSHTKIEVVAHEQLPTVKGSPSAINQILLNLIKNAADALGDDGGHIRVETEGGPDCNYVRVIDNGPGMDSSTQKQIFEPFFTTKKAGTGTGLGLSISRQIARSHGGDLTVESELGVGTTFTLRIPRNR